MTKSIKAYKGFDENLQCRGFQYEIGEQYEHQGDVEICRTGFHACKNPFDVLDFYGMTNSRFAIVTLDGEQDKQQNDNNSKIASAKITIDAELTLPEFISTAIEWIIAKTKNKNDSGYSAQIGSSGDYAKIGSSGHSAQIGSSGYSAQIGSSGYSAQIGSSGHSAQIGSSGYSAKIGSSGDYAKIGSSGDYAKIGSSGDYAQIGSSGYSAQIGSSGDYAKIGSSGYSARIGSSGHSAQIEASGNNSVIASAGYNTVFKAAKGTWVSIAEFNEGKCVGFVTGQVGTKGIKPDVLYQAANGKFVEISE